MKKIKICLACSAGGHLREIMQLSKFYKKFPHFFFTFKRQDSESLSKTEKVYFAERPARNPLNTLIAFIKAIKILKKENPDLIISTGADISVPMCFAAKLLGKKVVFIESFCRPLKPGLSGRLVYPIADLFIVQWKKVQKFYPNSIYGGQIF